MPADSFRDLVRVAQAGAPEAIERLFREVLPFVTGAVRAVGVAAGESVSDLAQDTCVRILSKLSQFRGAIEAPDDEQAWKLFRRWVRTVVHSVIVNGSRRAPKRPAISLQSSEADDSAERSGVDPPGREPTGSANLRVDERARSIQEAIEMLPDATDREILRRRFFESQTVEAIATDLGLTCDQVRYRCEKSLKRLRHRLEGLL